jgi:hypothetical protein
MGQRGEVFSSRASTAKRTYFFNVKENRNGDLYLNIVESKQHAESDFERQSVIVFREDLENFLHGLEDAVRFIRKQRDEGKPPPPRQRLERGPDPS